MNRFNSIYEKRDKYEERIKAFTSEKDAYIEEHTTGDYEDCDEEVVEFIADILYDGRNIDDAIRSFFRAGYCYYFASMLETAFDRGGLYLALPFGHIVWKDMDGWAYDIEGPYIPEEHECEDLIPVSYLGDLIYDFMHVPGKEFIFVMNSKQFHEWAAFMHMTDAEAVTSIFMDMPKDNIDYTDGNISDDVYAYWAANEPALSEKYWEKRKAKLL